MWVCCPANQWGSLYTCVYRRQSWWRVLCEKRQLYVNALWEGQEIREAKKLIIWHMFACTPFGDKIAFFRVTLSSLLPATCCVYSPVKLDLMKHFVLYLFLPYTCILSATNLMTLTFLRASLIKVLRVYINIYAGLSYSIWHDQCSPHTHKSVSPWLVQCP